MVSVNHQSIEIHHTWQPIGVGQFWHIKLQSWHADLRRACSFNEQFERCLQPVPLLLHHSNLQDKSALPVNICLVYEEKWARASLVLAENHCKQMTVKTPSGALEVA